MLSVARGQGREKHRAREAPTGAEHHGRRRAGEAGRITWKYVSATVMNEVTMTRMMNTMNRME